MMPIMPTHCLLVSGVGGAETELESFDVALMDAKVGNYNLVKVSSIFPPQCKITKRLMAPPGSVVPTAFAHVSLSKDSAGPKLIAASIAVALPINSSHPGVIMEWHGFGTKEFAEEQVRGMAERAMGRRNYPIKSVESVAVSLDLEGCRDPAGSVFAAALLF